MKKPEIHIALTGNPGTGKTTVARILGKLFYAIGLLSSDKVIECDRSKIVAKYVGHTAQNMQRLCDDATGGILFIDEVYTLSTDDFGREATDTLMKRMEDGAKIEEELLETDESEDSKESKQTAQPQISSDRMASILETAKVKMGGAKDEMREQKENSQHGNSLSVLTESTSQNLKKHLGYYVYENSDMTMHLILNDVNGSSVTATVRTRFSDGGYSTENYSGVMNEDGLMLEITNYDLHPLPAETITTETSQITKTHKIKVGNKFIGHFRDNGIFGKFEGEFSGFVIFRKQ